MRFPATLRFGIAFGGFALTLAQNSCAQNVEQANSIGLEALLTEN